MAWLPEINHSCPQFILEVCLKEQLFTLSSDGAVKVELSPSYHWEPHGVKIPIAVKTNYLNIDIKYSRKGAMKRNVFPPETSLPYGIFQIQVDSQSHHFITLF